MERFLTKRLALIGLTVVVFFIAWNRGIGLLYGMFSLLLATTLIGHLFPRLGLKGLSAARWHRPTAFEGEQLEINTRLTNTGRRSRRMIEILDHVPAAEPGQQHPPCFIAKVAGRKSRPYAFNVVCHKRGEYELGPLTLRSGFPLGVATRQRSLPDTVSNLLVYPAVFPIASLPLMGGSNMPLRGVEAVSKAGGGEDFFGTREYQQGDSPRYIHWPSTARHGTLIVKEFEIRAATEVTIVLDLHPASCLGSDKENTLEYAIKIAASIANYVLDRGHDVQLVAYGARPYVIPAGRGVNQLARLLEELARATADGDTTYPQAINRATTLMRDGGTAVLIFSDYEERLVEYRYSLALLKTMRIQPFCIFLNKQTFLGHTPKDNAPVQQIVVDNSPAYFVNCGDKLESVFSMS